MKASHFLSFSLVPLLSLTPFMGSPTQDETGGIAGRILFEGLRPAALPDLERGDHSEDCDILAGATGVDWTDRALLIDEASAGVANVVLTVRSAESSEPPAPAEVELRMTSGRFEPHVVVVPAGGALRVINEDAGSHNIHTYSRRNPPINRSVKPGDSALQECDHRETFSIRDDIHAWMLAHVVVTDAQHWAVSGKDGSFALEGLAPGRYSVSWWHETLGRGRTQELLVEAGKRTPLAFEVSLRFDVRADAEGHWAPPVDEHAPESEGETGAREHGGAHGDASEHTPDEPAAEADAPADVARDAPADASVEAPAATAGRTPAPAPGTGHVELSAIWSGALPEAKPLLEISQAESTGCLHGSDDLDRKDRTLLVDPSTRGVENVVFFLEQEGLAPIVPAEPVQMDQAGCRFEPHVLVVPVGARLAYTNSDGTNHNVHSYARKNEPVNRNVGAGDVLESSLVRPENFEVKCDIHPWMKAHVIVTEASRFAVTPSTGTVLLRDVPPGSYAVSWWHETLGKGKLGEIEVSEGEVTSLDNQMSASTGGSSPRRRR